MDFQKHSEGSAFLLLAMRKYSSGHGLFEAEQTVIAACSGGPDSMALVELLRQLAPKENIKLCVAHYEHGIRGDESKVDAEFVRDFCCEKNIPFYMESGNVPQWAEEHKLSLETAARELRYGFLYRLAESLGNAVIATAHHRGDQAETVLQHILRGSGLKGLSGIRPKQGILVRPLLFAPKSILESFCAEQGIVPRRDATNDIADCTRNRIRLELMPTLREYNPDVEGALCRLADLAREDESFIEAEVQDRLKKLIGSEDKKDFLRINRDVFREQPEAVRGRVLRCAIEKILGHAEGFSLKHFKLMDGLILSGDNGAEGEYPHGIRLIIQYGDAVLKQFTEELKQDNLKKNSIIVFKPLKAIKFCGRGFISEILDAPLSRSLEAEETLIDLDKVSEPLVLRTRQPGDRIELKVGHKKLKDVFTDSKIPRDERDRIPILADSDGRILWVAGVRRSITAMPDSNTKRFLYINFIYNS